MQKKVTRSGRYISAAEVINVINVVDLPALSGRDHHDVVHLGVDGVHPLGVLFRNVHDPNREHQPGVLPVVDIPRLTPPAGHQRIDGSLTSKGGSQIWCGGRAGCETSDSRMTSSSFFFLKPSEWKRNSSGSSGSSATASAAVSAALSGWYSQVTSGAG